LLLLPASENGRIARELSQRANELPTPYLFELANRLYPAEKEKALEWYAFATVRTRYDSLRCVDESGWMVLASGFAPMGSPDLLEYVDTNRKALGEAGLRVLSRPGLFVDNISTAWICGGDPANTRLLKPPTKWPEIRRKVLELYRKFFADQGNSHADPVPLTKRKLEIVSVLDRLDSDVGNNYGWRDSDHLVIGKRVDATLGSRNYDLDLMVYGPGGKTEVFTRTRYGWCAAGGVITYVDNVIRALDEEKNRMEVRFKIGADRKWDNLVVDMDYMQVFRENVTHHHWGGNGAPTDARQQSRFNCRWEQEGTPPPGLKVKGWIPLLPGDGKIWHAGGWTWQRSSGELVPLETHGAEVTNGYVKRAEWDNSYFLAATWSRFFNLDKSCYGMSTIYPESGRVVSECLPLDPNNQSNALTHDRSRIGLLRIASDRKTPIGDLPGGIYLLAEGRPVEKLLEASIKDWSVSPDGCSIAYRRQRNPKSWMEGYTLEILRLCGHD
jgi:hypothetical protein